MVRDREEEELHSTHPPPFWGDILGQHTKSEYPLRQIRLGINIERINSVNFTKDNILYFGCKQLQYYFCQGKWPTALMRRVQSPCSQFWGTWKFRKIIGKNIMSSGDSNLDPWSTWDLFFNSKHSCFSKTSSFRGLRTWSQSSFGIVDAIQNAIFWQLRTAAPWTGGDFDFCFHWLVGIHPMALYDD